MLEDIWKTHTSIDRHVAEIFRMKQETDLVRHTPDNIAQPAAAAR